MSDYESIHGTRVKYLTSDPTLNSSVEGQVWYNSTSGTNKALVQIKAFSSSANTPTNFVFSGGVGGQTDTLGFGGVGPSPQPAHNLTIEYSGFSWTGLPNLNTSRRAGYAFGTSTSAVYAAGDYSPGSPTITLQTEEWNGSSWTTGNNISEQGSFGAASGTLTAGLAYGGYNTAQTASSTRTVSYDGTNWTALPTPGADTNVSGNFTLGGGGTQTAAIFSGGSPYTGSRGTSTETFDGSSWTSQNNMNTGRGAQGLLGTQTNALYAGGRGPSPSRSAVTEEWDASSWTTSSASLSTARSGSITSKGGSTTAAVIGAGTTGPSNTNATEEYNSNINAFTAAAWSSGGALGTGRYGLQGAGTTPAGLGFGGYEVSGGYKGETEEYNGSSWSENGDMNTARGYMVGFGTQTAALASGGNDGSPPGKTSATEEYNGSSWSEVNNGNDQVKGGGCGTQTAGLTFGGQPGARTDTAEYDGTNWTTGGALNTGRTTVGGGGTQTAGMAMCGETPPANRLSNYEEYNGSSWTAGPNLAIARNVFVNNVGTQTAGLMFGGTISHPPTVVGNATEQYNGTSWSSVANLATGRTKDGGTGIQTAGLSFGGQTSPGNDQTTTEEFVTGSETITASTLTTS